MTTAVIIGGGAAGIFGAVALASQPAPRPHVIVLERSFQLLAKVRISGGGRCNVTHAAFDIRDLVQNYPRGQKELIGPFNRYGPRNVVDWYESRGVPLKIEEDGRIFPVSDSSESIIACLLKEAKAHNVDIRLGQKIAQIRRNEGHFEIALSDGATLCCQQLLLATGSSPHGHGYAKSLGHTIVEPVPSLFTFNVPASPLSDLSGISVEDALLSLPGLPWQQRGPLLLTHWGFSGPAALKLSAWAARDLHAVSYRHDLKINWLPQYSLQELGNELRLIREQKPTKLIANEPLGSLPHNLWRRIVALAGIPVETSFSHLSNIQMRSLQELCHSHHFQVSGKTTYKYEFVTSGGVSLAEIDFKRMASRLVPGLFFAGEVLDVDGVTGGFNFQNAWTSAWIAAHAMQSQN